MTNAARYTPPGGNLSLSVDPGEATYTISVADDGVGIPLDMQSIIFEKFAQIEAVKGSATGGLGIGLALVRDLVDLHGGVVTVRSEGEGQGSTFGVTLPCRALPDGGPRHVA